MHRLCLPPFPTLTIAGAHLSAAGGTVSFLIRRGGPQTQYERGPPPTAGPLVMARKREAQRFPISAPASEETETAGAWGPFQSVLLVLHKENRSP